MKSFQINGKNIGAGHACYVIAELSANHAGSFDRAMAILKAAQEAGADAIKLQTYTPDTMTLDCDNEYFRIPEGSLWTGRTLYDLYAEAMTPWEWHAPLKKEAERLGLDFFSTPFDETAVDFLEKLGVGFYKIASFELTDDPLLARIAGTGRPVIMSTGLASREEVARAVSVLDANGSGPVALLKCTSAYPAAFSSMNLRAMQELGRVFKVPVGISDHSPGSVVPVAAVALGASIIEKHLRLDDGVASADSAFSLTPAEFALMVRDVRNAQRALGTSTIGRTAAEEGNARFRRSVFVSKDIAPGDALTPDNIKVIRPGFGLAPASFSKILGKKAAVALKRGAPLASKDISQGEGGMVLNLRPAAAADARFLFDLRNAPDVRQNSTHSQPIAWETHEAWITTKLQDPRCRIMIVTDGAGQPVGQARFDMEGNAAVVSIALTPQARGNGAGTTVLKKACAQLFTLQPAVKCLKARVKVNNSTSVGAFLSAGFQVDDREVMNGEDYFNLSGKDSIWKP